MRFFVDKHGDVIAIEGNMALCWTARSGWGGTPELVLMTLSDERALEVTEVRVPGILSALGAPMPSFSTKS
jgi:hypothetical protein